MAGIQLSIGSFDESGPPLCHGKPGLNGFLDTCYRCPHASRRKGRVGCLRYLRIIRARSKYGLKDWKALRSVILERDRYRCRICGDTSDLQVHHIDQDRTNDDQSNLVSLCQACHARAQAGMRKEGRDERVRDLIDAPGQ
ncbi:MAG: HNH endonuclease [Methanoregulaceae archaeon]|nr:HNH endonuclease [Methanoregulaceae archaeon]